MATRFYLGGTAPDSEISSFSLPPSGWASGETTGHYKASTTKTSTQVSESTSGGAVTGNRFVALFSSAPLAAQTISGTVKGQIRCNEVSAADNRAAQLRIRLCNGDGTTIRGTALNFDDSAISNEFATALTNRKYPRGWTGSGAALTEVAVQAGDRFLIEVGVKRFVVSGNTIYWDFRDDNATDLGENETDTAAYNSWLEFSMDIVFAGAGSLALRRLGGAAIGPRRGVRYARTAAGLYAPAAPGLIALH